MRFSGYNQRNFRIDKGITMAKTACALHILVDNEKLANELLAKLKRGVSFDTLARKYSSCPSKRNGGSLGEFNKGAMVPAFDKAVFSIPLLKPYGPVKTQFGYHIIKVAVPQLRGLSPLLRITARRRPSPAQPPRCRPVWLLPSPPPAPAS